MSYLYRNQNASSVPSDPSLSVNTFTPSLFHGFFLPKEQKVLKTFLVRLLFYSVSFGKARIYYVTDEKGTPIHTSYVVPKCIKFPFMKKGDLEIGPCFTAPAFRGRGIYPKVIERIVAENKTDQTSFYMIVNEENAPSIRGIEKSGFVRCGEVYRTKILKRYVLKNQG